MEEFREIRKNTDALLQRNNVPIHPYLPLLDIGKIRSADEIANKIVSLYCLAGIANGADADLLLKWLNETGGLASLDDKDRKILENSDLPRSLLNEFSWKQESLYTLCWTSEIVKAMQWPNKECDLSNVFSLIPPEIPIDRFKRSLVLRKTREIVEALDFYYNLHASLSHPELWNGRNPAKAIKIEVVIERRQALEWVCADATDWDDISLDT